MSRPMNATNDASDSSNPGASAHSAWRGLQAWWAALAPRERQALTLAAAVLGAYLFWAIALAPAWRILRSAPAQIEAGETQARQMQAWAAEAKRLRAVVPVPMAQAQQALTAATERLGGAAKLSLQGERAIVSVKGLSGDQLAAWLAEARAGARARVVEASLSQTSPGLYDGSLTLALGAGR
jgi:general secretion pathway protein M